MDFQNFVAMIEGDDAGEEESAELDPETQAEVKDLLDDIKDNATPAVTAESRPALLRSLLRLAGILKVYELRFRDTFLHSYDRKEETVLFRLRSVIAINDAVVKLIRDVLLGDSDPMIAVTAMLVLHHTAPQLRMVDFSESPIIEKIHEWVMREGEHDPRRAVATVTLSTVLERPDMTSELVRQNLPREFLGRLRAFLPDDTVCEKPKAKEKEKERKKERDPGKGPPSAKKPPHPEPRGSFVRMCSFSPPRSRPPV